MELKEFITKALTDVTDAIKDCQQNIDNGAIFAPTNTKSYNRINTTDGELTVSDITFDVAVTVSSENSDGVYGGCGINVLGLSIGAKGNCEDKAIEATTSRIKFSIPVIYPPTEVRKKKSVTGIKHL